MPTKFHLTNEGLKGIFKNNFDLANFAIRLGRYYLKSGHEISADELLEQIRKNHRPEDLKELENEMLGKNVPEEDEEEQK